MRGMHLITPASDTRIFSYGSVVDVAGGEDRGDEFLEDEPHGYHVASPGVIMEFRIREGGGFETAGGEVVRDVGGGEVKVSVDGEDEIVDCGFGEADDSVHDFRDEGFSG